MELLGFVLLDLFGIVDLNLDQLKSKHTWVTKQQVFTSKQVLLFTKIFRKSQS